MKKLLIPILASLLLFAYACSGGPEGSADNSADRPKTVGEEPVTAKFVEQDSFNLPYWLEKGAKAMVLVRLSGYDGLSPVDADVLSKIKELAGKRDFEGLRAAGNARSEDHLYDASSVVYAAHALGIVRELYWVVPTFTSVTMEDMESFKDYLSGLYPDSAGDIDAMTLTGGVVKGRLNGIPVRMVCLEDLESPGEPVLLDIDASFFQTMYKDEKSTKSLTFISGMFNLLSEAGLTSDAVSISASGDDGRAALRLRAFSRYVERMLAEPGLVNSDPPELWSERAEAWRAMQNNPEIAVPTFKRIIERFPEDAASRYDLASVYFSLGEIESCAAELESATRLDPGYMAAFDMFRDSLEASGEPDIAARFYARRPTVKG